MTSRDTLTRVHRFVEGKQAMIEKHVHHVKFGIRHKVRDHSPYNEQIQHLFKSLPYGFFFPEAKMGNPKPQWADYVLAKTDFSAKLKEEVMLPGGILQEISDGLYYGVLLHLALELFEAVWLLVHTFPEATKSAYTLSTLPVEPCFHMW